MIKFTLRRVYKSDPVRLVYVNPNLVTHVFESTVKLYRRGPDGETLSPPEEAPVTVICFAAGLHKESDSVTVEETLDTVVDALSCTA